MAFEFIREELHEARYIRRPQDVTGDSSYNIAETFYEHLLALQQLRYENPALASEYAKDTYRFMNFRDIKTGGTDLHNLAAILNNQQKYKDRIADVGDVYFDELRFKRYLRNVIDGKADKSMDRTMFYKMQRDLNIRNSFLRNARRILVDYDSATPQERKQVATRLMNTFRQNQKFRSDIFRAYAATAKNNDLLMQPEPAKSGIPGYVKGAAALAGIAAAGYALGRKLA